VRDAVSRFAGATQRTRAAGRCNRLVAIAGSLLVSLGALIAAAPANAAITHVFDSSVAVTSPLQMAVDEATGSVYVVSSSGEHPPILKLDAEGAPSNFSSLGSNELFINKVTGHELFLSPQELAVDNSGGPNDGVLYVGRSQFQHTDKPGAMVFGRSGGFIGTTGPSSFEREESHAETFGNPCGVAVDSAGKLYLEWGGVERPNTSSWIDKYKPGEWVVGSNPEQEFPISGTMGGRQHQPGLGARGFCHVAIDTEGAVYTDKEGFFGGPLRRYSAGVFSLDNPPFKEIEPSANAVAVDPTTNDVYVDTFESIKRYDQDGTLIESLSDPELGTSAGVAVNGATHTVYVSSFTKGKVLIFKGVVTPDIEQVEATAGQTSASLSAQIGTAGAGDVEDCKLEYRKGGEASFGSSAQCSPDAAITPYTGPQGVSVDLTGLEKETTYEYRFAATNANATHRDVIRSFTTHNVADVTTEGPTGITQTSATLHGSFAGNGEPTSYYFEWDTGPFSPGAAGHSTTPKSAGSGTGHVEVPGETLTGLSIYLADSPAYHYRLVAENSSGKSWGDEETFHTLPPEPPVISGQSAGAVTESGAVLSAAVNPEGGPTVYGFEYGPTAAYGTSTQLGGPIGEADDRSDHPIESGIAGLAPGTTYHFRAVAINFGGTTHGPDMTFTTPGVIGPPSEGGSGGGGGPVVTPPPIGAPPPPRPKRCRKGFVRRHGKCVKRHRRRHHRRHHHHHRGSKHG
jgi:hypothetical protein